MLGKTCGSSVIMIAITVVLIGIVLTLTNSPSKDVKPVEHYADLSLNTFNKMECGRNLVFPNHKDSTLAVAARAYRDASDASCPTSINVQVPSEDHYEVRENEVVYNLRSRCMSALIVSAKNEGDGTIMIEFSPESLEVVKEMVFLNPLFIEFNKSVAYVPTYYYESSFAHGWGGFTLTNITGPDYLNYQTQPTRMRFYKIAENGSLKYSLNSNNLDTSPSALAVPGNISMTVYYLKIHNASSYMLPIQHNPNVMTRINTVKIFDKAFNSNIDKNIDPTYFFHQKFDVILRSNTTPVFTMKYAFNLSKNKTEERNGAKFIPNNSFHEMIRVFMDIPFGQYTNTWGINQMDLVRSSNMFAFYAIAENDYRNEFFLVATFPSQGVGEPVENLFVQRNPVYIALPYSVGTSIFTVTATFTSVDMIIKVEWKDSETRADKFVYKRRPWCGSTNLYNTIFTDKNRSNYNDIYMKYDNFYVTNISPFKVGYRDFNEE